MSHQAIDSAARLCIDALRSMTNIDIAISSSSTSDLSFDAISGDRVGFSVDIGNYDFCQRQQGLHHCLAGSVLRADRFAVLAPHAGICVPTACDPISLQNSDIKKFLFDETVKMVASSNNLDASASVFLTPTGQQKYSYMTKLQNIFNLIEKTGTGYTCGDNRASMTFDRYVFFSMFAILILTVIACTLYHMSSTGWSLETMRSSSDLPQEERERERGGANEATFRPSMFKKWRSVIEAFSLVRNIPLIFEQPHKGSSSAFNNFAVLDGFRSISILWIVLGHTMALSCSIGLMNPAAILPPEGFMKEVAGQIFFSSRFAVDTFFFISGFLVVSSLLRRLHPIKLEAQTTTKHETSLFTQSLSSQLTSLQTGPSLPSKISPSKVSDCSACKLMLPFFSKGQSLPKCKECKKREDIERERIKIQSKDQHQVHQHDHGFHQNHQRDLYVQTPAYHERPMPPLTSWLPMFYIHRLVRILPPYVFCLLLWWKIGVLLGSGPFWYRWNSFSSNCDKYFWTNLLFINNLWPNNVPETSECFYVSWYLAVDMQYYIISPFIVWIFLKNNTLGIAVTLLTFFISIIAGIVSTIEYGLSAHSFDGANVTAYSILFYTKPFYRIAPYCVGILTGMFWHIKCHKFHDYRLSPSSARFLLLGSVTTLLYLVFGFSSAYQRRPCDYLEPPSEACGSNWSIDARVLYNSFSKPLWAIALATITLLSGNDQGGSVQTFLSHPSFSPLARISFSIYLLHVLIINIWTLSATQKKRYSHFDLAMTFCAVVTVSGFFSLLLTVMIESPAARLGKVVETFFITRNSNKQAKAIGSHYEHTYGSLSSNETDSKGRINTSIEEVVITAHGIDVDNGEPINRQQAATPTELSRLL